MGQPGFFAFLRKAGYVGAITTKLPIKISTLSIELNMLIHKAAAKEFGNEQKDPEERRRIRSERFQTRFIKFFITLTKLITDIIMMAKSESEIDALIIVADGPVPISKMNQQRQRRYTSKLLDDKEKIFDHNAITPGTPFMQLVDENLMSWIKENSDIFPKKTIYSNHLIEGEGEHKIYQIIRSQFSSEIGAHVIYGVDADLIMLSTISPIENIYLIREDQWNRTDILNFNIFKSILNNEHISPEDFVIMFYLIGNDFIPGIVSLNIFSRESMLDMINIYKKVKEENPGFSLYKEKSINWEHFKIFIRYLAIEESNFLVKKKKASYKNPFPALDSSLRESQEILSDKGERVVIKNYEIDYNKFRSLWYQKTSVYGVEVDQEYVNQMCIWYLSGITWILKYYQEGAPGVNVRWYYPYYYAPLLTDLFTTLESFQPETWTQYPLDNKYSIVNPLVQMLYVMPRASVGWMVDKLMYLVIPEASPLSNVFNVNVAIDVEGKNEDFMGTVIVAFPNIEEIENVITFGDFKSTLENLKSDVFLFENQSEQRRHPRGARGGFRGNFRGQRGRDRGRRPQEREPGEKTEDL